MIVTAALFGRIKHAESCVADAEGGGSAPARHRDSDLHCRNSAVKSLCRSGVRSSTLSRPVIAIVVRICRRNSRQWGHSERCPSKRRRSELDIAPSRYSVTSSTTSLQVNGRRRNGFKSRSPRTPPRARFAGGSAPYAITPADGYRVRRGSRRSRPLSVPACLGGSTRLAGKPEGRRWLCVWTWPASGPHSVFHFVNPRSRRRRPSSLTVETPRFHRALHVADREVLLLSRPDGASPVHEDPKEPGLHR